MTHVRGGTVTNLAPWFEGFSSKFFVLSYVTLFLNFPTFCSSHFIVQGFRSILMSVSVFMTFSKIKI